MLRKILSLFVLVTVTLFAAPIPSSTVSTPGEQLMGEGFTSQICISNTGDATGYQPGYEVIIPGGVTLDSAKYIGTDVRNEFVETCTFTLPGQTECNATNPYTDQNISLYENESLYLLAYPLGSFPTDMPSQCMDLSFTLGSSPVVTVNVPLDIKPTALFYLGSDPLDNPQVDPPIYGTQKIQEVIPVIFKLNKNFNAIEKETVSGENFPNTVTLSIDIASGETVQNVSVTDDLPGELQYISMLDSDGCTVLSEPSTAVPGGTLSLDCSDITGVIGIDKNIVFSFYVPERDDNNDSILDPLSGAHTPVLNEVTSEYTYASTISSADANDTLMVKPFSIQKDMRIFEDNGVLGLSPTDILEYNITVNLSDYFDMENMILEDILNSTQSAVDLDTSTYTINSSSLVTSGNFTQGTSVVSTLPYLGVQKIDFDLSLAMQENGHGSSLMGGVGTGTGSSVIVSFQAKVDKIHRDGLSGFEDVKSGDLVNNDVDMNASNVNGGAALPSDGSSTSEQIAKGTGTKEVYAINGNTNITAPYTIKAGDTLTYRVVVDFPINSFQNGKLTDYLPLPIFQATEMTPGSTAQYSQSTIPPDAGQWSTGPVHDIDLPAIDTDFNVSTTQNTISWTTDPRIVDNNTTRSGTIDLLFTLTATNTPMADELNLANLATITYENTVGDVLTASSVVNITTYQPVIKAENLKSIVSSSNTASQSITPPNGFDSALNNVDANDTITYLLNIRNTGHATAYDINLSDRFFQNGIADQGLNSCTIINIEGNSTGTGSGDLFAGIYTIDQIAPGAEYDIRYTCVVDQDANPGPDIDNIATLLSYASTPGGPNFVNKVLESKSKLELTGKMQIVKNIVSTSIPDTSGNSINQGEIVYFEINVTLGEGTYTNYELTDNTCTNLQLSSTSANVTASGLSGTVIVDGTGGSVDGTLTYTCEQQMITSGTNTATVTADLMGSETASTNWTVVDPNVVTSKNMNPSQADAGDTVTVTMDWTNDASNPAYQCTVTDPLDASVFDISSIAITTTPAGYTCSVVGNDVECVYTGNLTLPCPDGPAEFTVNIRDDVNTSANLVNELTFTGVTLPSGHPEEGNTTINGSVESNAADTLELRSPSAPVKIFTATSENFTDPGDTNLNATPEIAIGEVIDVNITYGFHEGTTLNVDLDERFLDGGRLAYVPGTMTISRSDSNLIVEDTDINSDLAAVATGIAVPVDDSKLTLTDELIRLPLGDVTNLNSGSTTSTASFTLHFRIKVQNEAAVQAGVLIRDRGRVRFEDSISGDTRSSQSDIRSARTAEPLPLITKDVNQTNVRAGTELTYTLRICNDETNSTASVSSGFDWFVSDRIPDDMSLISGPTVDLNGTGAVVDTSASSGQDINVTIDRLDPGECVSIEYEAQVQISANIGEVLTNTANFMTTSLPGDYGSAGNLPGLVTQEAGELNGKRTGTGGVNDLFGSDSQSVTMDIAFIEKRVIAPKLHYAIGEKVHYQIDIASPPGSALEVVVNDLLPVGLEFNASDVSFRQGSNLIIENFPPNISQNGQVVSFDFGDINVLALSSIIIDFNATVANIPSNQDGISLQNDVNATFVDPNNPGQKGTIIPLIPTREITIGEPNLEIQKSITAGAVNAQAGEMVSWQVVLSNDSSNNAHTTAYAVDWEDVLPTHLAQIQNYTLTQTGADVTLTGQTVRLDSSHLIENNTTLSLPSFDLPVGSTVTITFDSIVQNDAVAGEIQTNTTNASYMSLPGADGSLLGGRNSDNCGDDDDNTTLNNYCESATADLIIDAGISIDKRIQGTQVNYTIGEELTYEMRVSLIEGVTKNVVLTDILPAGLRYVSHAHQNGAPAMTYDFASADLNGGSGQNVIMNFGDVNNSADGNITNDHIDIELTVLVENVVGNQNGDTPSNGDPAYSSSVTVTSDANSSALTVPVPINIVEPDLNVTKSVTPGTQATGDIVTYTIRLAHSNVSTSDAYDINFTDTLPADLTYIPGSVTGVPAADFAQNGQILAFNFAHLALATTREISYKARISDTASITAPLVNALDTVYSGLPDANGSADGGRNGTDGVGGALNNYALYTQASVQPNNDALTPVKSLTWSSDVNNDTVVSAGDHLTYGLLSTNNLGYDVGDLNISDTLDENVTILLNSIKVEHSGVEILDTNNSSIADWSVSGYWYTYVSSDFDINYNSDTNYFELYWQGLLQDSETFAVTFDVKINDGSETTVVIDNTDITISSQPEVIADTVIANIFSVDSNRTVSADSNEVNITTERRVSGVVPPVRGKELTATDQSFTDPGDTQVNRTPPVAVGEVVDIKLVVQSRGGITRDVFMRDNFNTAEFVFVSGSMRLIRSSTDIEVSQPDLNNLFGASDLNISVDDSLIVHDTNGFELSLGDVSNSNYTLGDRESLTMTFKLRVDNNISVQQGDILNDHGSVIFLEFDPNTNTSSVTEIDTREVGVVVVEPDVEVTKTVNPSTASAGDMVTYMIKVCNDESNTTAHTTSAFDWSVTDTLPDELDLVGDPQYNGVSMFSGADMDVTIPVIVPGECVSLEYNVTVNGAAQFEQDINNSVRVESTSLPGAVPGERTGTGIVPNDLNSSSTATLKIEEPGVVKAIIAQKAYYPIGDIVEYNITLGFTASARDLTIVDHFPDGLVYVPGSARLRLPAGAVVSYDPPLESNNGHDWTFVFGDLNITTAGDLYLELNATVEEILFNVDGVALTNSLDMSFTDPNTGAPVTIPAVAPSITVGEPELHLSKSITTDLSIPKSAGDTISYEIVLTNSGTTTAYSVIWEDKVPEHTGEIHNPHLEVHAGTAYEANTTTPITDANFTISTVDEPDDQIILVPFDLSPGASLVITFDSIIQPNVIPAEILVNSTSAATQSIPSGGRKSFVQVGADGLISDRYVADANVSFSINQLPEAIDDCTPPLEVTHYGPNEGDLGSNDILGDGTKEEHTWRVITQPTYGTVVINEDGTYTYTPYADYNNVSDSFSYEIEDSNGDTDQARVCIDVNCASSQTSDSGDALGVVSMLMLALLTLITAIHFVRKEEERGNL